jgi:hypothetical protein
MQARYSNKVNFRKNKTLLFFNIIYIYKYEYKNKYKSLIDKEEEENESRAVSDY